MIIGPVLEQRQERNYNVSDIITVVMYNRLLDLAYMRYDLYTHRYITTAIMLAVDYKSDEWLCETFVQNCHTAIRGNYDYQAWHQYSRYVTDHLSEDDQPGDIVKKLLKLYKQFVEETNTPINDHLMELYHDHS